MQRLEAGDYDIRWRIVYKDSSIEIYYDRVYVNSFDDVRDVIDKSRDTVAYYNQSKADAIDKIEFVAIIT